MNQLELSLQLLDESAVKSHRGLLRSKESFRGLQQQQQQFATSFDEPTLSGTLDLLQDVSAYRLGGGAEQDSEMSIIGASTTTHGFTNIKEVTKGLCEEFLEILQRHNSESNVFETIDELIETLNEALVRIELAARKLQMTGRERHLHEDEMWLNAERETWKLMASLYRDRLVTQKTDCDMEDLPLVNSERAIIEHLYAGNENLREYQMIVDWLEKMVLRQNQSLAGTFTNHSVAWENTLHQLLEVGETAFGSTRELVKSLDPDAPLRENRPLHDLDAEDQVRLAKHIFLEIRSGRLEEAQNKCDQCGQSWMAAVLEGWRLHHDSNYGNENPKLERNPIEGNPRRDLWKKFAWKMAESRLLNPYIKASIGALCGHLDSMVEILSNCTWNDMLWAYLKAQIDIRVESEIRSHCIKSYLPMPEQYWNGKMSLEQIFGELEAHKNACISLAAKDVDKVIQKYMILDDIPGLMRIVDGWLSDSDEGELVLSQQMLRFLSHFVMCVRQIGKPFQQDIGDRIIKRYVEHLIQLGEPHLVAFYTATLPPVMQLMLYSNFLMTIRTPTSARKRALVEAYNFGLDVPNITVHTVEKYRAAEEDSNAPAPAQGELTDLDREKISSLEWLTFYPEQRGQLLWQANALIRYFLGRRCIEAAQKTFALVPADTIEQIFTIYGSKVDIPCKEEVSIREYLCHQTYLGAIDGYNGWSQLFFNGKPKPPPSVSVTNFTERVTSEHREQAYKKELDNWEHRVADATKRARDLLYNVLLFPETGWLVDPDTNMERPGENDDDDDEESDAWRNRAVQMENLRKLCIPEVVLLLHQLHTLTNHHDECMLLASVLSSESRKLYSVFSKHKLAEVLAKLAESSLTLMNDRKDPFVGEAAKK
ncbi:nuclear pore complex protein Nup107 [Anopheles ziemanni]|uniref:nuclear pore complex protein Nup107 n=1 Tax=Anopheles coustani TaxID=139045 RepID=UPI002657B373|nr:nuclear pore complex protein Nup107 [Anopheles coustani]XP_058116958.1 nuclear pore complex protein Nup107 [Anopheles coustani]XP_058116959.1 nuclear pore complex protein Nup107 [Anopheles coustani]XP_058172064.1 nuclear pore complex protein Nup107 [Anopheles ziemanni]